MPAFLRDDLLVQGLLLTGIGPRPGAPPFSEWRVIRSMLREG